MVKTSIDVFRQELFACMAKHKLYSNRFRNNEIYLASVDAIVTMLEEFFVYSGKDFYKYFFKPYLVEKKIKAPSAQKEQCIAEFFDKERLYFKKKFFRSR